MKDELEDFVNQNRNAFDDKEPSEKVWRKVEESVQASAKKAWWNSVGLWRAAAVIFMALSIYLLIPKTDTIKQQNSALALKEFSDVESFYIQQISDKVDLIDEFQRKDGVNGFTQDFKQLEAQYMVLREEMKIHPSQKVKDGLVLNLLVRIDLLNQQLHKLDKGYKDEMKPETNI